MESLIDSVLRNEADIYSILDYFVSYLLSDNRPTPSKLSPNSISLYVAAVRSFLQYNDTFNTKKFTNRMMTVFSDDLTDDNLDDLSDEILKEEIKTWFDFGEILRSNDRKLFYQMLNECQIYEYGAYAKGSNMSTESLLISIFF